MVKLQRVFHVRTQTHLASALAGRCFNSFWLWKPGVNCKLAPFLDRIHSAQVKTHRTPCSLPRDNGNITERKWAQTTAMCTDESWCRTRGGAGGFEHRKLWFHVKIPHPPRALTWSYSDAPGYRGQPKNSSAMTQPSDHMSMASQNGKPRMISGALVREKERKSQSQIFYSESCISSL